MTNQQKFYLLDSMIENMERVIDSLDLSSTSGYSTFLAAIKAQRATYFAAYNGETTT